MTASTATPQPPPRPAGRDGLAARLATAVAGIPLLLAIDLLLDGLPFALVIAAVVVLGFLEFARALDLGRTPLTTVGLATAALLPVAAHAGGAWPTALLTAGVIGSLAALVLAGEPPASL